MNSPQFAKVQAAILRALAPHAAARLDVVAALRELDDEAARPEPRVIEHSLSRSEPVLIDVIPPCPVPIP